MKKTLFLSTLISTALLVGGCNKNTEEMAQIKERQDAHEKRIEALEKGRERPPMPPPEQEAAYSIPTGDSPVLGNKTAKVSIVIFSDMQCGYCKGAHELLKQVPKDPELKNVNVVFKQFPLSFHEKAKGASKAALAAHLQGKFWEMSDKIFENQGQLSPENYKKWAKEIGLNVAKWEKDLKDNDAKFEDMIKADMDLGINTAKVRGTPSIYVGGWEFKEQRTLDNIKKLLKSKGLI